MYVGYSGPWTYSYVADWLRENNASMGPWELFHSVLGLSIGLVPFICAVIWSFGKRKNLLLLLSYSLFCWGITFLMILIIFNFLPTIPTSFFVNKKIVLPSELFWNYALILASVVGPTILLINDIAHRRSISSKNLQKEKSLDHLI